MVSVTAFWPRRRAVVCRHRTSGCSPAVMASLGTLPSARGRAGRPAGLPALPRTSATSCRLDRDMVEERRQTFPWLPAYELPYPFGRLWRAFPALRPARALASRIPLGLGPWLHRLRRDPSPLVRRLHSYYDRVRFLHAVHHRLRISPFLSDPAHDSGMAWRPPRSRSSAYVRAWVLRHRGIPAPLAIAVGRMLPSVLMRTSASRTYQLFGAQ